VNISFVWKAFSEEGSPIDEGVAKRLEGVFDELTNWTAILKEVRDSKNIEG
jgi:hypothetical protein